MSGRTQGHREAVLASIIKHGREHSRLSVLFRELVAQQFGISAADGECVDFLMEAGSATAGDLARLTGLTTGAITGVTRRLRKAGLVTAKRDPSDRRKVIVKAIGARVRRGVELYASYGKAASSQVYARYALHELETIAAYHRDMSRVLSGQIQRLTSKRP
jgi:MarR family transcriptional regulator, organic hydroperoxide resistance regulator